MKILSLEQVEKSTKEYFAGDQMAANIWISKYCLRDSKGNLYELNPDDMHHRLASEFARIEKKYPNPLSEQEIYDLLKDFKYIVPQGSPMYGIGNNFSTTSLSNCFVIGSNGKADSYGSIMRTDEEQIQLMKRRGGVGHDLSHLRPSGATANNAVLGDNAGSTLYMERFSNSTREVAQDGRRGALMLSIDVRHPDTSKFIDIKLTEGKVTGANISVKITDEFMECVEGDGDFWQTFPVDLKIPLGKEYDDIICNLKYNELTPIAGGYIQRIRAKELWNKIIINAHKSAEPGVLFWDKILSESPAGIYGEEWKEVSVNPCAELTLCEYDSCRLLAINLYSYVNEPFTDHSIFDFDMFVEDVRIAQRLMDDLVDLEIEKIDKIITKIQSDKEAEDIKKVELELWLKIRYKAVEGRRTGLGITAEGDMLAALGLKYGSKEAIEFSVLVHKTLSVEAYKSSIEMAEERGCFPMCKPEIENNPFLDRVYEELGVEYKVKWDIYGRRNIALLTIAPTGTTSLMTQTTSGIEPLFMAFYKRRTKTEDKSKATFIDEMGDGWVEYRVIHPKFKTWMEINKFIIDGVYTFDTSDEKMLDFVFKQSPYHGATANEINWESAVEMQGQIQKWVDHSISKTINLPKTSTVEQVDIIYRTAHKSGCKGITVYRDGCRQGVLLSTEKKEDESFEYKNAYKRPKTLQCDIYHKTALKKNWLVIVGKVNNKAYEIFVINDVDNHIFPTKIEKGTITKVKSQTYELAGYMGQKLYKIYNIVDLMSMDQITDTRKYSSMLRHGMHPKFMIDQIEEYATIGSFDKVVQRVLRNYVSIEEQTEEKCTQCGGKMAMEEGCKHCIDCGWSKCG